MEQKKTKKKKNSYNSDYIQAFPILTAALANMISSKTPRIIFILHECHENMNFIQRKCIFTNHVTMLCPRPFSAFVSVTMPGLSLSMRPSYLYASPVSISLRSAFEILISLGIGTYPYNVSALSKYIQRSVHGILLSYISSRFVMYYLMQQFHHVFMHQT